MGGMAAVSGGVGVMGDRQRYKQEVEYQNKLIDASLEQIADTRKSATDAYISQVRGDQLQHQQELQAKAEQRLDVQRERRQAQSSVVTAAAEANVGGKGLDRLLLDFRRQEAMFMSRLEQQQDMSDEARTHRLQVYKNEYEGRINSVKPYIPGPIKKVDYVSPVLGIFQGGLSGFIRAGGFAGGGGK